MLRMWGPNLSLYKILSLCMHFASQGFSEDEWNNVICSMQACPLTTQWKMLCIMTKRSLQLNLETAADSVSCVYSQWYLILHREVEARAFAFLPVVPLSWPRNTWRRVFTGPEPLIGFRSCPPLTDRESPPQEGWDLIKSSARFRKTWLFVQHHRTLCDTPRPGLGAVTAAFHNSKRKGK